MKIIKNMYERWVTECPYCKSILELEVKDMRGGDVCSYHYKCAACKEIVQVRMTTVPNYFISLLEKEGC